jgi:predicted TPR repeat methyltransferase
MESHFPEVTKFYGFDISKDAIEIAKKKETNRIKFEIKNLSDKNEIGFYDLQLVIDVIEHIDNYFNFLTGIVSKSKYTIFHIPLDMCVWSLFRENMLIESKERVGHIHNFTEDFILNILTEYGFEIIDVMYTEPISNQMSTKQKFINLIRRFIFRINKKFSTKTLGGYSILVLAKNKS